MMIFFPKESRIAKYAFALESNKMNPIAVFLLLS